MIYLKTITYALYAFVAIYTFALCYMAIARIV